MTRVVDPIIADLQWEADSSGEVVRQGWIRLGAYLGFWKALAVCMCRRLGSGSDAAVSLRRAALRAALTVISVTALTVPVAFSSYSARIWDLATVGERIRAFAYLIPQGVPIALTLGVFVMALGAVDKGRATARAAAGVLVVACVVSAISAVLLSDVIPDANLAFRRLSGALESQATGRVTPISRGAPELSWAELRELVESRGPAAHWVTRLHYHLRPAMVITPVSFALLGLSIAAAFWRRSLALITSILFLAYFTLVNPLVREEVVSPLFAAWVLNIGPFSLAVLLWAVHVVRRKAVAG